MIFDSDSSVLVLFCRRPSLGVGKQRIAAELGGNAALAVAELLLAAALEDARSWPGPVVVSPAAQEDKDWAAKLLPNATVIPQASGNLGTRICHVQNQLLRQGARRMLFIGSDSPALTPAILQTAATELTTTDVVLLPARDGGVTLLATNLPWPELADLPWETDRLGNALAERCAATGLATHMLAAGFDVDTRQDLIDTASALANDNRPARRQLVTWIQRHLPTAASEEDRHVSVIVPVFEDVAALSRLLQLLRQLRPPPSEIVVVDGAQDSRCRDLCAQQGAAYATATASRGKQLKLGADMATGDIFWFLHADSAPPKNALQLILNCIAADRPGGYFNFEFGGGKRWYKSVLAAAINLRARIGIPYGDQGIFVSRAAYESAGGHAPEKLFEEVQLIKKLRRIGLFRAVDATISVSPRRWEQDGWLHRSLHNRYLAIRYMLGIKPERLARQYGQHNKPLPGRTRPGPGRDKENE